MNLDKAEEATIRLDNLNVARTMADDGKVAQTGEPKSFHIADAGELLQQYGIKGKFMVGDFTFSATHTQNADHDLGVKEWVDVINNLNNPLAIASYKGLPNEYRIYTYATINDKNICVGVNVSLKDGEIALSNILSAYGRDIENLLKGEKKYLLYPASIKELEQRISQVSTTHNSWLNATSSAQDDAKVIKDFENPTLEAEKNTDTTTFDSEVGVNFRLSDQSDATLSRIEEESSEAYNSVMNVELPKAETPIEVAKNKQTERTLFRFDKDFASYKELPNEYCIYTYATINGKNICVGVNVSLNDGEIALSNILSAYGRNIENLLK